MRARGWSVQPLGSLLRRPPRYGIGAAAVPAGTGTHTYLRITDIDEEGRFRPRPRVEVSDPRAAEYLLGPDQLVFARTGASVGKSYLYDPADGELVYAGFLINIAPDPQRLNPRYLAAYVQSRSYWDWVAGASLRSGQPGLNAQDYASLPVPVPAMEVQEAIAAVHRDTLDQAAGFERLIEKKELLKRALMQDLLSARTRLAGFEEPWAPKPIRCLGSLYGGLTGKMKDDFGAGSCRYVPFMAVMASPRVDAEEVLEVKVGSGERQNQVRAGDLLFNTSSETPEELAMCAVAGDLPPATYLNSFCFGLRLQDGAADPGFLAYLFRSAAGRSLVRVLAQGATRYNLSRTQFLKLAPSLPSLEEQRAVARLLADADAEIDALRAQRRKGLAIGKGAMQELFGAGAELAVGEPAAV